MKPDIIENLGLLIRSLRQVGHLLGFLGFLTSKTNPQTRQIGGIIPSRSRRFFALTDLAILARSS